MVIRRTYVPGTTKTRCNVGVGPYVTRKLSTTDNNDHRKLFIDNLLTSLWVNDVHTDYNYRITPFEFETSVCPKFWNKGVGVNNCKKKTVHTHTLLNNLKRLKGRSVYILSLSLSKNVTYLNSVNTFK